MPYETGTWFGFGGMNVLSNNTETNSFPKQNSLGLLETLVEFTVNFGLIIILISRITSSGRMWVPRGKERRCIFLKIWTVF